MKTVRCNVCGRKLSDYEARENFKTYGYAGYGSQFDGSEIRIDFCYDCLDKIINSCAISPIIGEENV